MRKRDVMLIFRGCIGALEIMGCRRLVDSLAVAAAVMKEARDYDDDTDDDDDNRVADHVARHKSEFKPTTRRGQSVDRQR